MLYNIQQNLSTNRASITNVQGFSTWGPRTPKGSAKPFRGGCGKPTFCPMYVVIYLQMSWGGTTNLIFFIRGKVFEQGW